MRRNAFTGWWEGDTVYMCDNCGATEEIPFSDQDEANDYKAQRAVLRDKGWQATKVKDEWKDFCCEKCRNDYIRKHTS